MPKYPLKVYRNGTYQTVPMNIPGKCLPPGVGLSPSQILFGTNCSEFDIPHPQIKNEGTGDLEVKECEANADA